MSTPARGAYRSIYSVLLDDPDYQRLTSAARLVLLTARQCKDAGPSAIFRYYPSVLCEQTGLSPQALEKSLGELVAERWIEREDPVLWVRNGLRYDPAMRLAYDKHRKGVERHLTELPRLSIVLRFCEYYGLAKPFDTLAEPYREGIPRSSEKVEGIGIREEGIGIREKQVSGSPNGGAPDVARDLLEFLNRKARKHFPPSKTNLGLIRARLREGATADQCRAIIGLKCRAWLDNPKMVEYLRPVTLFGAEKFSQYVGELADTAFSGPSK